VEGLEASFFGLPDGDHGQREGKQEEDLQPDRSADSDAVDFRDEGGLIAGGEDAAEDTDDEQGDEHKGDDGPGADAGLDGEFGVADHGAESGGERAGGPEKPDDGAGKQEEVGGEIESDPGEDGIPVDEGAKVEEEKGGEQAAAGGAAPGGGLDPAEEMEPHADVQEDDAEQVGGNPNAVDEGDVDGPEEQEECQRHSPEQAGEAAGDP